jgi:uncharacterized protein YqjF (DUF2071 family)
LQALLPAGLELDTFDGKAYAGLIPFTMTGVRAALTPALPWLSSFHEINLRTYVHRQGKNPGVWFFSLDASSALAVTAARAAYHLPYFHAQIELNESMQEGRTRVELSSTRDDPRGVTPANCRLEYGPAAGAIRPAVPGTLEHFLVERYILYAQDEGRRLYSARVNHQPYPLERAELTHLDETLLWAAGLKRSEAAPMAHYAHEVNVRIYPPVRCV